MKRGVILAALLTACMWGNGYAQHAERTAQADGAETATNTMKDGGMPKACRKLYLGISGGINNPAGFIGLDVDVPLLCNLSIDGGYGSSTWGDKLYAGIRYYLKPCHNGWAFSAGVSHSSGLDGLKQELETVYGKEDVILNLKPQTNIFLGAYYFCKLGRRANRFYVQGGYSIPLSDYSYTETQGDPLTPVSDKIIKLLSPHGVMIGIGFSFAIIK